jgi:hypothetical protein
MIEMNTIYYYFAEKCLKEAFEECYSAIFAELNTEKAFNLNKNVEIIEDLYNYEDELKDDEMLIESPLQLKETIEYLIEECNLDIVNVFITEKEILDRLDGILTDLEEKDSVTKDFSITLYKNSNAETLFNIMFARAITLLNVSNYEETIDYIIDYEDYDYSAITDFIDQTIMHIAPDYDFSFDHIGGETQSDKEFLDLYYHFDKK